MTGFPQFPARNVDAIVAATEDEFSTELNDQMFHNMPAMRALWKNRGKGTLGAGIHKWGVKSGLNPNGKSMQSDADIVTFSQTNNITNAWYTSMDFMVVPVQRSKLRDSMNGGASQIFDLVKSDEETGIETMQRMVNERTFGTGANNTLVGLPGFFPSVGVGTNTLFNISESNSPFWKNYVDTSTGSFATNGTNGSGGLDKLLNGYLNCSDSGASFPGLIVSNRDVFQYQIQTQGQKIRITKDADFGNVIGRSAITGNAGEGMDYYDSKWVWDNECPLGTVYFVHPEAIRLIEDPNFNMKWIDVNMGLQFLLSGRVLCYRAQSEIKRRNNSGVQTGWTA